MKTNGRDRSATSSMVPNIQHVLSKILNMYDDDSTVSSILSGPETKSLGLNTLGTT